jgi:hypothetical protein
MMRGRLLRPFLHGPVAQRADRGSSGDVSPADGYLQRLDLALRVADAIPIAIVQRLGAKLVTFDRRMATAAVEPGVAVAEV